MRNVKHYSANHGNCSIGQNWRLLCTISVSLLFPGGAFAAGEPFFLEASGTESATWNFPLSGSFLVVTPYTATALAGAKADGTTGSSYGIPVPGTKLTYTPPNIWTPGTVVAGDNASGTLGSTSSGSTVIQGNHTGPNVAGYNTATVSCTANINVAPGGSASFFGNARDPYPFQMQDLSPIPAGTLLSFSLTLPAAGNSLTPIGSLGNWSVTYASYIADIDTSDVDTFYAANPALLYSLTLSDSSAGYAVSFVPGAPSGFPVTFSKTQSQIEAAVLAAVQGGLSSDLTAVSGEIDVSGHTSATIGAEGDIFVAGSIPEPSTFALLGLGTLSLLAYDRRRRQAKA